MPQQDLPPVTTAHLEIPGEAEPIDFVYLIEGDNQLELEN
jgi:hypothetical protein